MVEAQVWTLIGVLVASQAGLLTALFRLGSRIDALGARLDARIDSQGADLRARIDRIDAKLDDHLGRHAG
jgi:hypothetical protein